MDKIMTASRLAAVLLFWTAASAQSVITADHVAAARNAIDSAGRASQLRCKMSSVRPTLNFSLRFESGYAIHFPLGQLMGAGHALVVLLRVTPQDGSPVYLASNETLPAVTNANAEGEITGSFVVGDGSYRVEALLQDEQKRVCYDEWRIQAGRSGIERELQPMTPTETVEELSEPGAMPPQPPAPQQIERLAILLDAAPFHPQAAKLEPGTIRTLADSLSALLYQLPAKSVHVVIFNLDQQAVLFQKDGFTAADFAQVRASLEQLNLAQVDYRILRNRSGLLNDLVRQELRDPKPPSAIIFLGPHTFAQAGVSSEPPRQEAEGLRWFYLELQSPLEAGQTGRNSRIPNMSRYPRSGGRGPAGPPVPAEPSDQIAKLLHRWNGETLAVRTPHDLATALRLLVCRLLQHC